VDHGIDVGRVVAGKFELVRLLGRGSMGEVWVAHHRTLGEHVALKLLTNTLEGEVIEEEATATARFRFEAQIAARLSRKTRHIVRVTDHGDEDGLAYLVMELLEGQTLDTMIELSEGVARMSVDVVTDVVTQISRALTHAHAEGVFHRDLKPANVFVARDEDGHRLLKVLDFGIARAIHAHRVRGTYATAKGLVFGTPGYMSPEQARGSARLDHRCDVWALTVIAYECLTGRLPTDGVDADEILKNLCAGRLTPLRRVLPQAPQALADFFERGFHEQIERRPSTAAELAQEFVKAAGVRASADVARAAPVVAKVQERADSLPSDRSERVTNVRGVAPRSARVVQLAAIGVALGLTCLGVAWRLLAPPSISAAAAPNAPSTATPGGSPQAPRATTTVAGATPTVQPAPQENLAGEPPPLAVSSLPRAPTHPISAARGPGVPLIPSQPVAPTPPSAPPSQAPTQRPQHGPKDKSEVL
jgi:serine/threonine-protein kinase